MNLAATMSLNAAPFTSGLAQARAGMAGLAQGIGGALAPLAALAGVGLSIGGAFAGLKNAFDLGGQFSDLSLRTGETVSNLNVLRQVFEDTGIGADSVGSTISLMQKALTGVNESGQPTNDMFKRLGLSIEALKGMSATDQLNTIGAAIRDLKNPAEQTGAAMGIFGKSGAAMKQLFLDPTAFEVARRSLGSMPAVLQKNAALFDKISDTIGHFKTKMQGLFVGIGDQLAPSLAPVLEQIDKIDFTKIGQQIGGIMAIMAQAFKDGGLSELLALSLKIGIGEGANFLMATLNGAVTSLMMSLADPSVWKGIGKVILGVFTELGAGLINIFTKPLTILQAGMDFIVQQLSEKMLKILPFDKLPGHQSFHAESFSSLLAAREKNGTFLTNTAGDAKNLGTQFIQEGLAAVRAGSPAVKDAFQIGFADMRNAIDMSGAKEQLANLAGGLKANAEAAAAAMHGVAAAAGGSGDGGGLAGLAKMPKIEASDRFARLGMFIGGAGGPSVDYARRTAVATELINKGIQRVIDKIQPSGSTTAAWA
jgi:hypothetical protein